VVSGEALMLHDHQSIERRLLALRFLWVDLISIDLFPHGPKQQITRYSYWLAFTFYP
jgi:hypothetical protein